MAEPNYDIYIFASYGLSGLFIILAALHSWVKARDIAKKNQQN